MYIDANQRDIPADPKIGFPNSLQRTGRHHFRGDIHGAERVCAPLCQQLLHAAITIVLLEVSIRDQGRIDVDSLAL